MLLMPSKPVPGLHVPKDMTPEELLQSYSSACGGVMAGEGWITATAVKIWIQNGRKTLGRTHGEAASSHGEGSRYPEASGYGDSNRRTRSAYDQLVVTSLIPYPVRFIRQASGPIFLLESPLPRSLRISTSLSVRWAASAVRSGKGLPTILNQIFHRSVQ